MKKSTANIISALSIFLIANLTYFLDKLLNLNDLVFSFIIALTMVVVSNLINKFTKVR